MVGNPYMIRFEYVDGVMGTCLLLSGDTRRFLQATFSISLSWFLTAGVRAQVW